MEARKVCRLLIALFCSLAVMFYILYRIEAKNVNYLADEFVEGAAENLASAGVKLDPDIIDRKIPEKDIYALEFSSIENYHEKIVNSVVGVLYDDKVSTLEFDMPDGVSVGIYDNSNTGRELGRIVMNDSDLSFRFTRTGISINGPDSANTNGLTDGIHQSYKKIIDSFTSKLSAQSGCSYRICGSSSSEDYVFVSVIPVIEEYDIADVYLNFVFFEGKLVDVSGSWITEKIKAVYHNKLIDGVNVLYKLDLEKISEINDQNHVYFLRKAEDGKYFVVPGWEITYTEKNGVVKKAYFDAL